MVKCSVTFSLASAAAEKEEFNQMKDMNESYRRGFSEGMKIFGEGGHMGMGPSGRPSLPSEIMPPRFPARGPMSKLGGTGDGGTGDGGTGDSGGFIGYLLSFYGQSVPPAPAWLDLDGDGVIGGGDLGLYLAGITGGGETS